MRYRLQVDLNTRVGNKCDPLVGKVNSHIHKFSSLEEQLLLLLNQRVVLFFKAPELIVLLHHSFRHDDSSKTRAQVVVSDEQVLLLKRHELLTKPRVNVLLLFHRIDTDSEGLVQPVADGGSKVLMKKRLHVDDDKLSLGRNRSFESESARACPYVRLIATGALPLSLAQITAPSSAATPSARRRILGAYPPNELALVGKIPLITASDRVPALGLVDSKTVAEVGVSQKAGD